jgi:hypothetical protein
MANNEKNLSTGEEANLYIELGLLLQKTRDAEDSYQVQKIVHSSLPLQEKIERIRKIDNKLLSSDTKKNSVISDEDLLRLIRRKGIITEEAAKNNQQFLVPKFLRSGIINYFFREYRKLKKFEKETKIIEVSLFPPRVLISRWVGKSIIPSMQRDANNILSHLNFVLEVGWIILNKLEYNLIKQFKLLCEDIVLSSFLFQSNKEQMFDKFQKLQKLFLACHYQKEYPYIIESSIKSVLKTYNRPADRIDNIIYSTRNLLLMDKKPSFFNLVLAFNMVTYRRYFEIHNLIQVTDLGVINTFDFECPEKVRENINDFINKNEKKCVKKIEMSQVSFK